VPLSSGVVQKKHATGAETTTFAITRRQLEGAGEGDAELAARSRVPRPCPARGKACEYELTGGDSLSKVYNWPAWYEVCGDQCDFNILEMGLAVRPSKDSWITNCGHLGDPVLGLQRGSWTYWILAGCGDD
jgi:hypothetical protein